MSEIGPESLTIRPADPKRDLPGLVALNRFVQDVHVDAEPQVFRPSDDMPGIEDFHRSFAGGERLYTFVAELDSEPVGYVSLEHQRRDAHTFAWAQNRLYVHQISVHPHHRRLGIGRALMERVDALAAEVGAREVAMDTWSFNAVAQRFFETLGYTVYNLRLRKPTTE